jgi:hypothetical protein
MNRRETHVVAKIDEQRERSDRRLQLRERALDTVASAMREVIDPIERHDLARELVTATAINATQACGHAVAASQLSSLSGQIFQAAITIQAKRARRAR